MLKSPLLGAGQPSIELRIEFVLDLAHSTQISAERHGGLRAIKAMVEMNGLAKQLLHLGCPHRSLRLIGETLQITKLMCQAKLKDLGRRLQLRAETITDPNLGSGLSHHLRDHGGIATRDDLVVDG